jgi:hypothetical protein
MPLTWWLKTEKRDELTDSKTTNQNVIGKYLVENWNFPFLIIRKIFGQSLLWFYYVNGFETSLNYRMTKTF